MKKTIFLLIGISTILISNSVRAEEPIAYGDLYSVEWCPCHPEEPFDENGSVVMGKTVMCPCDGRYSGFKKGFDQDVREIKAAAKNQLRRLNYFKYYLGMDYNIGSVSTTSDEILFDDQTFAAGPIRVNPEDIFDDQDSLTFVAGARISKHWGLEAFYQQSYEDNTTTIIDNQTLNNPNYYLLNTYTTNFKAYGLDIIGYLPVSEYFDFVGSLGVAQYNFENEGIFGIYNVTGATLVGTSKKNFDEDKIGWRAGIGGQLNIADGVALRAMYKYIKIGGDYIEDMNEVSLGLRFLF